MILSFKTKINGKPTHFVEKIHSALIQNGIYEFEGINFPKEMGFSKDALTNKQPKLHTIRRDEKNRWKVGMMIDFFINSRTKDMFRFAPRIQVVSTQRIKICWDEPFSSVIAIGNRQVSVIINGCLANDLAPSLAINDGFDSVEDFFEYFNEDFEGKIIHWTDLKY